MATTLERAFIMVDAATFFEATSLWRWACLGGIANGHKIQLSTPEVVLVHGRIGDTQPPDYVHGLEWLPRFYASVDCLLTSHGLSCLHV